MSKEKTLTDEQYITFGKRVIALLREGKWDESKFKEAREEMINMLAKYKVGDIVYTYDSDMIMRVPCAPFKISEVRYVDDAGSTRYFLKGLGECADFGWQKERNCFATPEELIRAHIKRMREFAQMELGLQLEHDDQMIKGVVGGVEGIVRKTHDHISIRYTNKNGIYDYFYCSGSKLKVDDKVKILVVKEDQQ